MRVIVNDQSADQVQARTGTWPAHHIRHVHHAIYERRHVNARQICESTARVVSLQAEDTCEFNQRPMKL